MAGFSLPEWLKHRRLNFRVLLAIVLLSSLVTLVISAFQLYVEYRRDMGALEHRFHEAEASFSDSLAQSLWALDESQLELQLRGILQLPHVSQVELTGDLDMTLGEAPSYPTQQVHRFDLVYRGEGGEQYELGEVVVTASLEGIYARVWQRGYVILATEAVKTFAVALVILAIIHLLVTRHLQTLAGYARYLRLDRLAEKATLNRPRRGWFRPDELDEVVNALNGMRERLDEDMRRREAVEHERRRLAEALRQSPGGVVILDRAGRTVYANPRFLELSGCELKDIVGHTVFQPGGWLAERMALPPGSKDPWETVNHGEEWQGELRFRRADGNYRWAYAAVRAVHVEETRYYTVLVEDITRLKDAEERIAFHAHFDDLTELPNRVLAYEHLSKAIHAGQRTALVFLDLANFKYVNETLGHDIGDQVLVRVAGRLGQFVREDWTLARFGSDEFLVIIPGLERLSELREIIEELLARFEPPFQVDGHEVFVSATAGVAVTPRSGASARGLIRAADTALYVAKADRLSKWRFYDPSMGRESHRRLTMEAELRQALANGEFQLYYQPIVSIAEGELVGIEALLRWNHPERGLIGPDEFIGLSEENALIVPIGEWALRQAVADLVALRREGVVTGDAGVSVNISPRQLYEEPFDHQVRSVLSEFELEPRLLELEITERMLIEERSQTRHNLAELENMGVRLSVDDFGTGYSALSYFKRFRVDTLKIDKEFIESMIGDEDQAQLVMAVVSMAHGLKIRTVAEGIETTEQHRFLEKCGCDYGQGNLFLPPLPLAELRTALSGKGNVVAIS